MSIQISINNKSITLDLAAGRENVLETITCAIVDAYLPSNTYVPAYWSEHAEVDEKELASNIRKAINNALEGNTEIKAEFNELLNDAMEDDRNDFFYNHVVSLFEDDVLAEIDSLEHLYIINDAEDFAVDVLQRMACQLESYDKSTAIDTIPNQLKLEFTYMPEKYDTVSYNGTVCTVSTVCKDAALEELFKLAKVSPKMYANYIADSEGHEVADEFYKLNVEDYQLEEMLLDDLKEMTDIIENATYGGTPVIFGFVKAKDILGINLNSVYELSGALNIGIVDYSQGSGYLADCKKAEVELTADNISLLSDKYYGVDQIFGFTRSEMKISKK